MSEPFTAASLFKAATVRLEDGRPPSELRHPALDSSLPSPPVQTRQ
ncbi:MAG: hypothetical protein M3410_15250 [Acidobacteriota bacterium]|nr:hypothetical protein [Acidobacteriota bacterium]